MKNLKLDDHNEEQERKFELDFLLSLSTHERFQMMLSKSDGMKLSLIRNEHRKPVEIIKREFS